MMLLVFNFQNWRVDANDHEDVDPSVAILKSFSIPEKIKDLQRQNYRFFNQVWKLFILFEESEEKEHCIKKSREATFFYTVKNYCLGPYGEIFGNLFEKIEFLRRAFVPLWGRGINFFGSRTDILYWKSWKKMKFFIKISYQVFSKSSNLFEKKKWNFEKLIFQNLHFTE